MQTLLQDLRYSFRMLLKSPRFTAVAVGALALGIGANTAIFSLVNTVLLRQLPFKDPERLTGAWSVRADNARAPFSIPNFLDYRDQNQSLEQMAAFANWSVNVTGAGDAERLQGVRVTGNMFATLGVEAMLGRTLQQEDARPGSPRVAVVSYGFWQRRMGGDRNAWGIPLRLNGESYTVIGVLPPSFFSPLYRDAELFAPLVVETDPLRADRTVNFLRAIARLKPGVTPQQAGAEMEQITRRIRELYPEANARSLGVRFVPLHDEIVTNFRQGLLVLLGAVTLVLFIACANLANLQLARASARHKEVAIRTALGASRAQLIRQLLTESVLLALIGGGLGVLLARWGVQALIALSPAELPRAGQVGIDAPVLVFTFVVSLLAGVIFGLAPALQASKTNLNEELNGTTRGSTGSGARNRARNLLVISEVALSLVLLTGAGLFLKSFLRLQGVSPGFDTTKLLVTRLSLPRATYSRRDAVALFQRNLQPRLENLPGVQSAGTVSILPLSGLLATVDFQIDGRSVPSEEVPEANYRMVSLNYFRTMRIPLQKGREFTEHDTADAEPVAIINQTMAERHWPGGNAIGAHMAIDDGHPPMRKVEIIGVVGDVAHTSLDGVPLSDVYVPYAQIPEEIVIWAVSNMYYVVRTGPDPLTLASAVRREVRAVDADVAASSTRSMEQFVAASVAPRRFNFLLLGIFGVAALLLATSGIYAVISYSVTQRAREVGIRMALGARPADVLRLVIGNAMRLAGAGLGVGLAAAWAATRLVAGLLFGVSPTDPATFAAVAFLLGAAALAACWIPARRATRVDPIIALRFE